MDKELALKIIFWFFLVLSIILIIWFIFGRSPPAESIIFSLFATFIAHLYHYAMDTNKRLAHIEADIRIIKETLQNKK